MRLASGLTITAALTIATPAVATSTIHCTSPQDRALELYLSVGNGEGGGIDYVRIIDGRRELGTAVDGTGPRIRQNLVNPRQLSFRITDANADALVASLDARVVAGAYVGTLRYRGRSWRISCRWDEDE
jgi:hypothetical protein